MSARAHAYRPCVYMHGCSDAIACTLEEREVHLLHALWPYNGFMVCTVRPNRLLHACAQLKELYDPILAYRFNYPSETTSGKPLRMVLAHEPEKYSSAAPLTADARQRIGGPAGDQGMGG